MLNSRAVDFEYRDYTNRPLSVAEIEKVLEMLGLKPGDVLRKGDRAYRELGLDGTESDTTLLELMSDHPTLLQRPIGVLDGRAALGRPPENILELLA